MNVPVLEKRETFSAKECQRGRFFYIAATRVRRARWGLHFRARLNGLGRERVVEEQAENTTH